MLVPQYMIGTEIETILTLENPCEECIVCQNCSPCDYCDQNEIIEYARREGYINENDFENNEEVDVCEICQRYELYRSVICEYCNPCENCEYYDYKPLPYYLSSIEKFLDKWYEDGSCGLELCTKAFDNIREYYQAIKEIINTVGVENIKIKERCGGHINISWTSINYVWIDFEKPIVYNLVYFSDLLTYMHCSKYTYHRRSYKDIAKDYDGIYDSALDKYHCIHLKDYAIEVRYPDSPKSVLDHLLLSVVNLSLSFITQQIKDYKKEYEMIYAIYTKINYDGEKLSGKEKRYLRNKFKLLIKSIKPYLRIFSRQLKIDLQKALETRIQYPRYEYGQKIKGKIKFSEELFKIKKPKTFESSNHPNQISLCMF